MDPEILRRRFFDSLGSATQWLELFDYLPGVYLYVKDRQGRFMAVNRNHCEMRGIENQSQLWGKTDLDLHAAYWGRQYREEDRRVMEGGETIANQVWLVPVRQGRLGTFVSSKMPLRSASGDVVGLAGVMYRIDHDNPDAESPDAVDRAAQWIAARFGEPVTVSAIAAAVSLSPSQLNRRFRSKFQMSPSEYLQRVRVYQATRLLSETRAKIGEVALRCGFYDQAHLTRTFRKWMRCTPGEYRELPDTRPPDANTAGNDRRPVRSNDSDRRGGHPDATAVG